MENKSLYSCCVTRVSQIYLTINDSSFKCMPTNVMFDVLYQMSINGSHQYLIKFFTDLDTFYRFLVNLKEKRNEMHFIFQSLMDFGANNVEILTNNYSDICANCDHNYYNRFRLLRIGYDLGSFMKESGWFCSAIDIFNAAIELFDSNQIKNDYKLETLVFECRLKLLSVLNSFCCFDEANQLMRTIQQMIVSHDLYERTNYFNFAQMYAELAQLYFLQSYYDESYKWSIESLKHVNKSTPIITVIDVYRQAAKTSVVKRQFKTAELLINQAMLICKETFQVSEDQQRYTIGVLHLKLAEVFLDYGFYLLNVDLISHSVKLYEMALEIREHIFGLENTNINNLLIAMTHEELGYASYVHEYSSGNFLTAIYHADKAMSIVTQILPENHLLLASAKRVKALILEEIAIDHHDKIAEERMLNESQELHLSALNMARKAFGEKNVQTAKHYGNLGRLYQSMKRFNEAEEMHLKAIKIKEQLLGPNDYEVALSLGHLASLYNYDMAIFEKAEELYLRSVDIGIKLFGIGYSGLEYDYRGLIRVYSNLKDLSKLAAYVNKLHQWKTLRDSIARSVRDSPPIKDLDTMQKLSLSQILLLIDDLDN